MWNKTKTEKNNGEIKQTNLDPARVDTDVAVMMMMMKQKTQKKSNDFN